MTVSAAPCFVALPVTAPMPPRITLPPPRILTSLTIRCVRSFSTLRYESYRRAGPVRRGSAQHVGLDGTFDPLRHVVLHQLQIAKNSKARLIPCSDIRTRCRHRDSGLPLPTRPRKGMREPNGNSIASTRTHQLPPHHDHVAAKTIDDNASRELPEATSPSAPARSRTAVPAAMSSRHAARFLSVECQCRVGFEEMGSSRRTCDRRNWLPSASRLASGIEARSRSRP